MADVEVKVGRSARIILTGDFLIGDDLAGDSLAGDGLAGETLADEVFAGVLVLGGSHFKGSCGVTDTGVGPSG